LEVKLPSIKFHEEYSNHSAVVAFGEVDRHKAKKSLLPNRWR